MQNGRCKAPVFFCDRRNKAQLGWIILHRGVYETETRTVRTLLAHTLSSANQWAPESERGNVNATHVWMKCVRIRTTFPNLCAAMRIRGQGLWTGAISVQATLLSEMRNARWSPFVLARLPLPGSV